VGVDGGVGARCGSVVGCGGCWWLVAVAAGHNLVVVDLSVGGRMVVVFG
jgi:hypothetical protein